MTLTSPTTFPNAPQQVILHGISWQTYGAILRDMGDHRGARLTYDQGVLEITMPSDEHERLKHLLERIITDLTFELGLEVIGFASITLNRQDLARGLEPDACYYIQNASKVPPHPLDLTRDPPPDLVVEIDITHPSDRKLAIYAQLGVGEVWFYAAKRITLYVLTADGYVPTEISPTLGVSAEQVTGWLEQGEQGDNNRAIRAVRAWVRGQRGG